MGDYNVIIHPSERSHGASNITGGMDDLIECCNETDLSDIKSHGHHLTWNKSPGKENGLRKKLDRAMVNSAFLDKLPHSTSTFMPPLTSNHTPILISIPSIKKKWKPHSCKFMNFLTRKEGFRDIVKEEWQKEV
ncbi:uncharacterized protein LOC143559016 [Bidens hawaiensis]|uniref:uncharacterized protein LOC143559016 n=1 Tax=Bidens hawaiensis TaxID=980011 RepID=UPI00404938BE